MNYDEIIKKYFNGKQSISLNAANRFFKIYPDAFSYVDNILKNTPEWETHLCVLLGIVNDIKLKKCKICRKIINI